MPLPQAMLKRRRCYYYEDDGRPITSRGGQKGCPEREFCTFAHPNDPQWATATRSNPPRGPPPPPPPASMPSSTPLRPPPLPTGPPPAPAAPPPTHAHQLPPKPTECIGNASFVQGSDRDRDDNINARTRISRAPSNASPVESVASSSDPRLHKRSPSGMVAERRREDDRKYRDDERRREDDRRYDVRSRRDDEHRRDEDRRKDEDRRRDDDRRRRDDDRRVEQSRDRRSRSHSRTRRDSYSAQPPKKEFTEEEKRQVWMDRLKILSESVVARTELLRLQEEVRSYERLTKSTQWEIIPEGDKKAMIELIATMRQRVREKQMQINSSLARLVPTDYYPFVTPPSQQSDAAFSEMTNSLSSLREDVMSLFDAVGQLQAASIPVQTPITPLAPSQSEVGEIIEPSTRPKKRRRLSVDEGAAGSSKLSDSTIAEVDRLQDIYTSLEGRVEEVKNYMRQYDTKVADDIEAQLDYFGLLRTKGSNASTNVELTERVKQLRNEMSEARARAAEVTNGLAQLHLDGEAHDKRNAELQAENAKLLNQIAEMKVQQEQMVERLNARTEELSALNAAVTTLISQPPYLPPPEPPSTAAIIAAIKPRLLRAVRSDIQPLLADLRLEIDKALREQLNNVNGALTAQFSQTIRSVELISAWVERIRDPPANGAPPSNPGPPSSIVDQRQETGEPS